MFPHSDPIIYLIELYSHLSKFLMLLLYLYLKDILWSLYIVLEFVYFNTI